MLKYNPYPSMGYENPACKKCGSNDQEGSHSLSYHEGTDLLTVTCGRCGYHWDLRSFDAPGDNPQTSPMPSNPDDWALPEFQDEITKDEVTPSWAKRILDLLKVGPVNAGANERVDNAIKESVAEYDYEVYSNGFLTCKRLALDLLRDDFGESNPLIQDIKRLFPRVEQGGRHAD